MQRLHYAAVQFVVLLSQLARALDTRAVFSRQQGLVADEPRHPVTRVVNLLKDMKEQLEKEQDSDEEVYEKLACWCETNDKAKTKAISDAEAKITTLEGTIEKTIAKSETLKVEIASLEKEIAENKEALATATQIREKQSAEFTAEEKEMIQSIRALDSAITVLKKHHGGAASLLDTASPAVSGISDTVAGILKRSGSRLLGVITPRQRRLVAALSQQAQSRGGPTFKQAYTPQSGEVFGILRQMKETFENDLSESQKEELAAQKAFDDLKVVKEEEIQIGEESHSSKKEQLADADEKIVQAKQEKEDTLASLNADQAFLMDLKTRCALTDKEWEQRQKTRQSELQAVAEAISVLSSDDARDLFSKTFNAAAAASFAQRASWKNASSSPQRKVVSAVLRSAASRTGDPRMSLLASKAQLDAFTVVKKAIDDMVAELLKEAQDEIKHRDFCIDEMAKNERSTAQQAHAKEKVEAKMAGLKMTIKDLNSTITGLESEITDLTLQRQRAKEDRDMEHKEFEGTVADQRETQRLLQQALDVMKSVYAQAPAAALAQLQSAVENSKGPPPPAGFKEYEKSQHSSGILALLDHILADAKAMEAEAMHAESQSLADYQDFVQETVRSIEAKEQSILERRGEKSQAQEDLTQAESEFSGINDELESLSAGLAGLKGDCDFFLKNFEVRTQAREEEVEALRQAKAALSGMQAS
jgi:hypothetical protein